MESVLRRGKRGDAVYEHMAEFAVVPLDRKVTCVLVSGEWDLADLKRSRRVLREALESDAEAILVDLGECGFIDVKALRSLADTHEEATRLEKAIVIADAGLQVERFLRILDLHQDFEIVETREKALERIEGRRRRFGNRFVRSPQSVGARTSSSYARVATESLHA